MRNRLRATLFLLPLLLPAGPVLKAAEPEVQALETAYPRDVLPLLVRYCHECHSAETAEADVDLTAFRSWNDVKRQPRTWQKVGEMLDSSQMPPKDARQPAPAERTKLQQWVRGFLNLEARARAGDPGRVVLRRLNNAEYTYTLRDLTGVESLNPAREFPVDGAAGEGFTNTGNALVMSPALLAKYLEAAKGVASHAVLLPDGFRFSPYTTRRDWTNEVLSQIRNFYGEFADAGGGTQVNLQGIVFDTNSGGRLAIEKYLAATIAERETLQRGRAAIDAVARRRGLNAKYLGILWNTLTDERPSLLLDVVRSKWRDAPLEKTDDVAAEVALWQQAVWKFSSVGHIGKVNGPKAWQEPVQPLTTKHEIRYPLAIEPGQRDIVLYLSTTDAGDGPENDFAVWERPRLVMPGRPDILLRDVRELTREMTARRRRVVASTAKALNAAAEALATNEPQEQAALAARHGADPDAVAAWFELLGIGGGAAVKLDLFTETINSAGYPFVNGWGANKTPLLVANSSDQNVRIPGNMKAHGVCIHPSPTLSAVVGWKSPFAGAVRIEGKVTHAHPECGNGVTWSLEARRGITRQKLAEGATRGNQPATFGPIESFAVQPGDLVSLVIGPRDGNHACDLTDLEFILRSTSDNPREWNLTRDVSPDVLAGNPHADSFGNKEVWHFYTEPVQGGNVGTEIPAGSLLARWQSADKDTEKTQLAVALQKLLMDGPAAGADESNPDVRLYRVLSPLGGPLARPQTKSGTLKVPASTAAENDSANQMAYGVDPALFGSHPNGSAVDEASLCVRAPAVIELRLPADLVAGATLTTAVSLHPQTSAEGSVQAQILRSKPERVSGLLPTAATETRANGAWTSNNRGVAHSTPIVVADGSAARKRIEQAFDDFRAVFPVALCYTKIVPVDEVVTLTLFYREDDALQRLMLDKTEAARLDRLWDELHFISQDAITLVDALAQLIEYATQDADPKVFEPLQQLFHDRADAFRKRLVAAEPQQLDRLVAFAAEAYRRPLVDVDGSELRAFYRGLREQDLSHDEAFRLTLARILVAPAFLYRLEQPSPGKKQAPVSDFELAGRLSYFLWSSQPDDELRRLAAAGRLHEPDVLLAQTRRMLRDPKVRRLATEFACQWLHIYEFDRLDEKSERHFPTFTELRGPMYEESIRFFIGLFQENRPVLDILDADWTYLNEPLAAHYAIPGVAGPEWRRVDGVKQHGRGGILAQATTLAKQSGASRTSPILRGNWISEVLLGERLPRPPKGVPELPADESATAGLTVRQLVEKHSSDAKCAVCHQRIDPMGFSLEAFDAIGRRRDKDLGDRPIDTRVKAMDGAEFEDLAGLRHYLLTTRRDAFLRQFCKKLLGYALGRAVQLSDEPLLTEMQLTLKAHDYQIVPLVETIVQSRQFLDIRGRETADQE
jgi:hypothetical protein